MNISSQSISQSSNPVFLDNDDALIDHLRNVMIENGDFKRLQQIFLSELVLCNRNSTLDSDITGNRSTMDSNDSNNEGTTMTDPKVKQTWINTILKGLRLQKDIDAVNITFDELKEIVASIGRDSVPTEVQSKMMRMIRSIIESMELRY
jgi:hypothetical protein